MYNKMNIYSDDPMLDLERILNPLYGLNHAIPLQGGEMSFNSTANPLVNQLNVPLSQSVSTNIDTTPTWGSAFNSFRNGEVGLRDLGGMLGSQAKSIGQGISSDIANNETYQEMHGNLSAKNQFGNIWGGLQALTGSYGVFKQNKMANKQFDLQNDIWNKSWDANKKAVNESVDLRAANRFNENPEARKAHVAKYSI